MLADELEKPAGVGGLADDLEAGAIEQARETFAQENVVVCDDDPSALVQGCFDRTGTLCGRLD